MDGAAAETDGSRPVHSRDSERSPPHKTRKIDATNRGDDGRGRRPRKGDAKRERKRKALEEAAQMCQYYKDDHGARDCRLHCCLLELEAVFSHIYFGCDIPGSPQVRLRSSRCQATGVTVCAERVARLTLQEPHKDTLCPTAVCPTVRLWPFFDAIVGGRLCTTAVQVVYSSINSTHYYRQSVETIATMMLLASRSQRAGVHQQQTALPNKQARN